MSFTPPATRRELRAAERAVEAAAEAVASGQATLLAVPPVAIFETTTTPNDHHSEMETVVIPIQRHEQTTPTAATITAESNNIATADNEQNSQEAATSELTPPTQQPQPPATRHIENVAGDYDWGFQQDIPIQPTEAVRPNPLLAPTDAGQSNASETFAAPHQTVDELFQYPAERAAPAPIINLAPIAEEYEEEENPPRGRKKQKRKQSSEFAPVVQAKKKSEPEDKGFNLLALISIVAGIVSIVFAFIPTMSFAALPIGGVALLTAIIALLTPGYKKVFSIIAIITALAGAGYNAYIQYGDLIFGAATSAAAISIGQVTL
jgi:hypothetical protein